MPTLDAPAPAIRRRTTPRHSASRPPHAGRRMTADAFLDWQDTHQPDGWKYEWSQGAITCGEKSMKLDELIIANNLNRLFIKTAAHQSGGGLFSEADCRLPNLTTIRRPDFAFFNRSQIASVATGGCPVPSFVIEVMSRHDGATYVEEKLFDYAAAGVQVVWHVIPWRQAVRVFQSNGSSQLYVPGQVATAAPALPDFLVPLPDLFIQQP